uniref:Uncharacterized protein n=1 Tax=Amphimedon queenslandica TaxID=400682 RepID=A0A1X7TY30_AMPQE
MNDDGTVLFLIDASLDLGLRPLPPPLPALLGRLAYYNGIKYIIVKTYYLSAHSPQLGNYVLPLLLQQRQSWGRSGSSRREHRATTGRSTGGPPAFGSAGGGGGGSNGGGGPPSPATGGGRPPAAGRAGGGSGPPGGGGGKGPPSPTSGGGGHPATGKAGAGGAGLRVMVVVEALLLLVVHDTHHSPYTTKHYKNIMIANILYSIINVKECNSQVRKEDETMYRPLNVPIFHEFALKLDTVTSQLHSEAIGAKHNKAVVIPFEHEVIFWDKGIICYGSSKCLMRAV